jgi:uroporphyrinogen decarboxylase
LTFCGGIDTQKVLPFGSVEEVRSEVRRMIGIMGKGGGYILGGSQALEDDISVQNILAMFDEAKKVK